MATAEKTIEEIDNQVSTLDDADLLIVWAGGLTAKMTIADFKTSVIGSVSGLSAEAIEDLEDGTADADTIVRIPGVLSGVLEGWMVNIMAMQSTLDYEEQTGLETGDYIPIWGVNGPRRISPTNFLQATIGIIDITKQPYNCKGDGIEVRDGVISTGNDHVVSAGALFKLEDVGKPIWIGDKSRGFTTLSTTIVTYVSPTEIVVASAPSFGGSSMVVLWGTDNTTGMRQAYADAAADPANAQQRGKAILHPPGAYITDNLLQYSGSTLYGYGGRSCFVIRKPSSSTLPTIASSNTGNKYLNVTDLGIYGCKQLQPNGSTQRGYYNPGPTGSSDIIPSPLWSGMWVWEAPGDAFVQADASGGVLSRIQILDCGGYGYKTAAFDMLCDAMYISGCSAGGLYTVLNFGGANSFSNLKISYNGRQPFFNDATHLDSGMGVYNAQKDNIFTNVRVQETWADGWVEAGFRTLVRMGKLEDIGNIRSRKGQGPIPSTTKARAYLHLQNCVDCDMEFFTSFAIPFSGPVCYGTHCLFLSGSVSTLKGNTIRIKTASNMKLNTDYYNPSVPDANGVAATTGAYAAALWGEDMTGSLDSSNDIKINGVAVTF